ncbi:MAG: IS4 family transposase, partial [Bacteroidota bacterium]
MNVSSIKEKLSSLPIAQISRDHRFNLRGDAKVGLLSFVGSFFLSLCQDHSLRNWASHLSSFLPEGVNLSKAGLQKRLGPRQLASVKAFLQAAITRRVEPLLQKSQSEGLLSSFKRVWVEDSVCLKLNAALCSFFPGSHSPKGKTATARIQLCLDLKTLIYKRLELMSYRENDQKFSSRIMEIIQAGELVIRDLGYWSLEVFAQIAKAGAFFLSRYRFGTNLYDEQGHQIHLLELLSKIERRGGNFGDQWVYVGQTHRLKVRLIALKCPPEVAQQRIQKAKKDRHAKANHSKEYYQLLRWTILLTNVEQRVWNASEAMVVYGFRWHIEMIFKVWKSALGLQRMMTQAQIKKPIHAQLFVYLFLSYLVLCYLPYYT